MARKRVKLQWVEDNAARKAMYKKRVKGLMNKVRELSTLCGVDACLITYSPYQPVPEVWPSPIEVEQVVASFRNLPKNDRIKKVLNQEILIWQRILKARVEAMKQLVKNRKREIENLRTQCLGGRLLEGLESKDVLDLTWAIDNQLEAVKKRIENLSLDVTVDALNNQPLTEQNPNENLGNELGDDVDSDFWSNLLKLS